MPIQPVAKIWMDGELTPWEDAKVHVLTHALHYGSGVFEGIRAYETKKGPGIFRLTEHLRRLFRSAQVYMMELPFSLEELTEATRDTVRANELTSCYIRPLAFRGYGEMGLNPLYAKVSVSIAVWPWGTYLGDDALENGARVIVSSWRRPDQNAFPGAKATGQYINSQLAKVEALKAGYDEAIMLSPQGYVSECTGENLFVVRNGKIFTPPVSAGALEGVTQDCVMTIARDLGYEADVANILRSDLYTCDEAFCTGTAAEVVPIREIDDRVIGEPGPLTKKIQETFFAVVRGEVERYRDWNEHV